MSREVSFGPPWSQCRHQQVQESVTSNETTIGRPANQFSDPRAMILSDSVRGTLRMNSNLPIHDDSEATTAISNLRG